MSLALLNPESKNDGVENQVIYYCIHFEMTSKQNQTSAGPVYL
jgi:hypothetical protein